MRKWQEAELCELEISNTLYGGINPENPDGYFESGKDHVEVPVTTFGS